MASCEDGDVCESWEEMLDSGALDEKLEKMRVHREASEEMVLKSWQGGPMVEESMRSQYVAPEPQVKILKRPMGRGAGGGLVGGQEEHLSNGEGAGRGGRQVKSLQQREQEYALARLRILGQAQSPEEQPAQAQQQQTQERVRQIQAKGEHGDAGLPAALLLLAPQQPSAPTEEPVNVVRLPRGPDGSRGFVLRR